MGKRRKDWTEFKSFVECLRDRSGAQSPGLYTGRAKERCIIPGEGAICRRADSELRRVEVVSHLEPHISKYPANISSAKHKARNSVALTSTVPSGSQHSRRDGGSMIKAPTDRNDSGAHRT